MVHNFVCSLGKYFHPLFYHFLDDFLRLFEKPPVICSFLFGCEFVLELYFNVFKFVSC